MKDESLYLPGIRDPLVLKAMNSVPRELFVPPDLRNRAFDDGPLPIGHGQTISQPFIVAYMTEQLKLGPDSKVLEVGTGSGYQAAILSRITDRVYTTEILPSMVDLARANLEDAGIRTVSHRLADGYDGWPEEAPFDGIMVTAAARRVPDPLVSQLADGGRMIIPVGEIHGAQELLLLERNGNRTRITRLIPVRFVPMTGKARG